MSTSAMIIAFVVIALICVVLSVLKQDTDSSFYILDSKLHKSHQRNRHIRGRHRSLVESGHLIPHHSSVHFVHNSTLHKKAWMHYAEVDGLKNEEVVMFVMSSTVKDGYLLRERVIAGARTWMKLFANVVVVIEDTFEIRYALRHCEIAEYDRYTTFSCHNEPTYLLSRECTNEYYNAPGICCKVDESIHYLVNSRPDFFAQIKYMLHSDDDTFWRPDQALKWLAAVENSGAGQYPLIANVQVGDDNNAGVYLTENCKEIHTTGWYQPTMLNRVALARMAVGAAAYGNRDVCNAFTISQDVGIGIFAWMYQTNHIKMPGVEMNAEHAGASIFAPDQVAVHFVKHSEADRCDGQKDNNWPVKDRYNQDMVIGCGDIGKPIAGHDKSRRADMYDAWEYFRHNGKNIVVNKADVNEFIDGFVVVNATGHTLHFLKEKQPVELRESNGVFTAPAEGVVLIDEITMYKPAAGEKIVKKVVPRLMPMRGYRGTKHSQENDITKKWKVFGLDDCSPPGKHA